MALTEEAGKSTACSWTRIWRTWWNASRPRGTNLLPAKRVYIPKNEHEKRPLGLPALEDKIVQKGIARILEAIYEADFCDCSYGFRPGAVVIRR